MSNESRPRRGRTADLGRHHQTTCCWVDGDISGHEADVSELGEHLAVLLVRQGLIHARCISSHSCLQPQEQVPQTHLDWTRVDDATAGLEALGDGILCDDGFSGTGVGTDEDGLVALDGGDTDFLEGVEFEGVDASGFGGWDVRGDGDVGVVRRERDLVANLSK